MIHTAVAHLDALCRIYAGADAASLICSISPFIRFCSSSSRLQHQPVTLWIPAHVVEYDVMDMMFLLDFMGR